LLGFLHFRPSDALPTPSSTAFSVQRNPNSHSLSARTEPRTADRQRLTDLTEQTDTETLARLANWKFATWVIHPIRERTGLTLHVHHSTPEASYECTDPGNTSLLITAEFFFISQKSLTHFGTSACRDRSRRSYKPQSTSATGLLFHELDSIFSFAIPFFRRPFLLDPERQRAGSIPSIQLPSYSRNSLPCDYPL
jgi:hypothetical protein